MAAPSATAALPEVGAPARAILEVTGLRAAHGRHEVVHGVDLRVDRGEVIALFGHNGAGKTTTLNAIFGRIKRVGGVVRLDGIDVAGSPCAANVVRGMTLVHADDFVFSKLTVVDNLRLGAYLERRPAVVRERLDRVHEILPILSERGNQLAGTLSGGQQRMLSFGIALMSEPRMLLLDEPSLGLSPALVQQIMDVVGRLAREKGLSVLLVEQNVAQTLPVVDRAYFMRGGRILLHESASTLRERTSFWDLF